MGNARPSPPQRLMSDRRHTDAIDVAGGDFLVTAAQFADRIRRDDVDPFLAQSRFAGLHLGLERAALPHESGEDLSSGTLATFSPGRR